VDVLESSPTGVAAFADDGTCATANEQFRTLFGLDGDVSLEALEAVPLTDHDGDVIGAADRPVRRVRRTNRPVVDEHVRVDTDDGHRWVSMTVQESDDGVVVTASDVTGVVERSRRLRRERDAVAAELSEFASHAVDSRLKLDEDGTVLSVDDRAAALLEPDVVELVGASTSEAFDALRGASAIVDAALESESKQTGDCRHGDRDAWFEVEAVPTTSGASVLLREVTEQVEHERELQRYVGVVDALGEPVYELDSEGRFAFVNDAITELSGYSREELLGEHVSLVIPDDAVDRIEPQISELLTEDAPDRVRSEYHVTTKRGHAVPVENRLTVLTDEAGNVRGNAGFVSDITERKERERELERYERIVETVEDGIYVLDQEDRFVVVNDAFASMAGVDGEDIIGQKASIVFDETFAERVNDRNAALSADTLESAKFEETFAPVDGDPLVVETRFTTFASKDGNTGRVGVVRDVGERVERERRIERQRARLEALNEVNAVVRDVATGAIDGSTREEIETMVCKRLAASNAYEFAWIGEMTGVDGSLAVRTAAGLDDPDRASLSGMLEGVRGRGAVSRAVRDRTAQTVQDASLLPTSDPWRALAARFGFRSAMAIPITHDGRMFGVLNVHTDRESAFADEERRLVEHIGEVVGHAIAAVERKRALASEAVLELDYRVPRAFSSLDVSESLSGTLTFDETVSTKGDEVLVYGTASPTAMESLASLVDEVPYWESVSVVDTDEAGNSKFELHAKEPPVFSMVTARGGYVDEVVTVDGNSRFVLHVPPGQDVRAITEGCRRRIRRRNSSLSGRYLHRSRRWRDSRTVSRRISRTVSVPLCMRRTTRGSSSGRERRPARTSQSRSGWHRQRSTNTSGRRSGRCSRRYWGGGEESSGWTDTE